MGAVNWLDLFLGAILAISIAGGVWKGFIKIGIGFAATVLGFVLAAWCYGSAGSFLLPYVSTPAIANVFGFFLVFFGVLALGGLVSWILTKVSKAVGLSWLDRVLGGLVGFVRGLLIAIVVVMVMMAFHWRGQGPPKAVVQSQLAPYVIDAARFLSAITPYEFKDGVRIAYEEVTKIWKEALQQTKKQRIPVEKN